MLQSLTEAICLHKQCHRCSHHLSVRNSINKLQYECVQPSRKKTMLAFETFVLHNHYIKADKLEKKYVAEWDSGEVKVLKAFRRVVCTETFRVCLPRQQKYFWLCRHAR